jgi:hypothetical protein
VEDIRAHGVLSPLKVTVDGQVIDGETRRLAAIAANLQEVPCQVVPESDAAQIILRELNLRRNIATKSQRAYLAAPLIREIAERANASRGDRFKNPNDSSRLSSGQSGDTEFGKISEAHGFSIPTANRASKLSRLLDEHPEFREQAESAIFHPEEPAGLGGVIAGIQSRLAAGYRERDFGIVQGGGKPAEVGRQLELFTETVTTAAKRWEYWSALTPDLKRDHWAKIDSTLASLPPDQCRDMADYYKSLSDRCRKAVADAKAA